MRKRSKDLTFYFTNVVYDPIPGSEFPTNLTIMLPRGNEAYAMSYILMVNTYDVDFSIYLGKIYNIRRVTTFELAISIRELIKIDLDWNKLIKETQGELAETILDADYPIQLSRKSSQKIKKSILEENSETLNEFYFNFNRLISNSNNPLFPQFIDAFIFAFNLFGIDAKSMNVISEEQIIDFDLEKIFRNLSIGRTIDGFYFFERDYSQRFLTVKAIHNRPISECSGIELVYNIEAEQRSIFVRYEYADDSTNKLFIDYKTRDYPLIEFFPDIKECSNFKASRREEMRICNCSTYIKLCSREIKYYRYQPYGFYYPVCIWSNFCADNSKEISYNDEPKISNHLFIELIKSKLIGSDLIQSERINNYMQKNGDISRLRLIFTETSSKPVCFMGSTNS